MHHVLPGGRFASERYRDLPALAAAVVRFMGIGSRPALASLGDDEAFDRESVRWADAVMDWLAPDLRTSGIDDVDWSQPQIVVALHEGMIDPLLLMSQIPTRLRFVARTELKKWPVIGRALEPSHQILLDPEEPRSAARTLLREGREALAAGYTPVVFAQGTLLGIEAAFERGAFHLARAADVPVVPVVIAGTHRIYEWPFSPVVRRRQPVHLRVLQPKLRPDIEALETIMRRDALENGHAPARHFEPDRDGWWDGYRFSISPRYPDLAGRVERHRAQDLERRATQ